MARRVDGPRPRPGRTGRIRLRGGMVAGQGQSSCSAPSASLSLPIFLLATRRSWRAAPGGWELSMEMVHPRHSTPPPALAAKAAATDGCARTPQSLISTGHSNWSRARKAMGNGPVSRPRAAPDATPGDAGPRGRTLDDHNRVAPRRLPPRPGGDPAPVGTNI